MTQKLIELFNLPTNNIANESKETVAASDTINTNTELLIEADTIIDRIDTALESVTELDATDRELDELANLARDKFESLLDLGMNVEARFSGTILQTAGTLLGHAITAKQAKIDRKIRTIDLQLKKARLDQISQKTDGEKLLGAIDGNGVVLNRTELLKQILGK